MAQAAFKQNTKPSCCSGCSLYGETFVPTVGPRNAEILIVGGFPLSVDAMKGAFTSPGGDLVRQLVKGIQKRLPVEEQTPVAYTYAVGCSPVSTKYKITVKEVNHCQPMLHHTIASIQPKLIIALGADASKALGVSASLKTVRGVITATSVGDRRIPLLPTYHPAAVMKSPGLLPVLKTDVEKAIRQVRHGVMESNFRIDVPETFEDIMASLDEVEACVEAAYAETGKPRVVALDTETTSVTPYNPDDRVIMVSLSPAEDWGIAFPLEHREYVLPKEELDRLPPEEQAGKFTPEHVQMIGERLAEVVGSEKVALVEHNGKFDTQWLRYRYGFDVPFPAIDTMLLEHTLNEDKKGEYSLKNLTVDYFPGSAKYEQELRGILDRLRKEREQEYKEKYKAARAAQRESLIRYWVEDLDERQRTDLLSSWDTSDFIDMLKFGEAAYPKRTSRGKNKGGLTKAYQALVARLMRYVPLSAWPEDIQKILADQKQKAEIPPVTFEDVPVATLAPYAARDAILTRKALQLQLPQFQPEHTRLVKILRKTGKSLDGLKHPSWALNNITMPLCRVLADMEYRGVRLDRDRTRQYIEIIKEKMGESEEAMFESVGYRFNPRSGELGRILYEDLGLPVLKTSELTGEPSTDADTLKELDEQYDVPFLKHLLVHRRLDKCASTYLGNWLKMSEMDGRIHAQFKQIGTATYRLSSSSPNLQNVPFELKEAGLNLKALFIPDNDDMEIYDMDISNAEMRTLTAYSNDRALIDVFNNNKDMHCLTAAGISEYSYDDILANKEDKTTDHYKKRQVAKVVNFG